MKNLKSVKTLQLVKPLKKSKLADAGNPYDLAAEFLRLKQEEIKIKNAMAKLRPLLKPALIKAIDMAIPVGTKEIYGGYTKNRSCDLEEVKDFFGEELIAPYITEKLDIESASKHLNLTKFIKIQPVFTINIRDRAESDD